MKIGIDAHAIGTSAGGNETYMQELVYSLTEFAPDINITAFINKNISANLLPKNIKTYPLSFNSSAMRVLFGLNSAASKSKIDLMHLQYNAPLNPYCPFVVSIHDLCWKKHPEFLKKSERFRLKMLIPLTIKKASRIFALTNAIKEEISQIYSVPIEKIDVVQPSINPIFKPNKDNDVLKNIKAKYNLSDEYIIYLGAIQPRKNLVRLAEAFSRIIKKGFPHKLVIIGKRAWLYKEMLTTINNLKINDKIIFLGYVERKDIPAILSAAACFTYISIYEGFGIPVVEAMACGVPVLTSSDKALQETAGDAALICDPYNIESIEEGIIKIITNTDFSSNLIEKGIKRANYFSRKKMASEALNGYKNALNIK